MCSDHKCRDNFLSCGPVLGYRLCGSIIPERIYREHFSDVPLAEPQRSLVTYTKSDVPVLGCLSATVQYKNTVSATLFVVKTGTTLLGMD